MKAETKKVIEDLLLGNIQAMDEQIKQMQAGLFEAQGLRKARVDALNELKTETKEE